jgi:hypothetical protein
MDLIFLPFPDRLSDTDSDLVDIRVDCPTRHTDHRGGSTRAPEAVMMAP